MIIYLFMALVTLFIISAIMTPEIEDDKILRAVIAAACAIFWPLSLFCLIVYFLVNVAFPKVIKTIKERKK